jgi:enediyne biosynthesis protein E4
MYESGSGMSETNVEKDAGTARNQGYSRLLLAFLLGAGLIAVAWAGWRYWRYRSAMDEVEAEIIAGRYSIACRDLETLLAWASDPNGRMLYLLGSCELARGRSPAADKAWARVVPGCAFAQKALESRVHLLAESGQHAAAERLAREAAVDPRNDGTALLVLLVPLYREQGRLDEAEQLIVARWKHLNTLREGALEPAIKLVREHVELTLRPEPAETTRAALERAAELAPDDERVWLGRANLALRTGDHDQAERWINACRQRSPDDVPVWHAFLRWGIAAKKTDVVTLAISHLPANELNAASFHRTNAWLAAQRSDIASERRELELLLEADHTDLTALTRLAELAEKEHQPAKAAELVRTKAQITRLIARYRNLHDRKQPIRDAEELARIAEQLGRPFEARVFLTVAISEDPGRIDLRQNLARVATGRADP